MSKRSSVFIPVVSLRRARESNVYPVEGQLLEVFSCAYKTGPALHDEAVSRHKADLEHHDQIALAKDFDPVAAPLRSRGAALYRDGCAASGAVYKLGLRRPVMACHQWLRPRAWIAGQRLMAVGSRGPDEGRSAQLGLALALLSRVSASAPAAIIATGALERDHTSTARSSGLKSSDVEVVPVGELPAKLCLILDAARRGVFQQLEGRPRRICFFTPRTFEHNGQCLPVQQLKEVDALKHSGIEVIPIQWLSEAAEKIGARRTRYLTQDYLCQVALGCLLLLVVFVSAWSAWTLHPIPMAFLEDGASTTEPTPFRVCTSPDGTDRAVPLKEQGLAPIIPAASTIGWVVQIGEDETLDAQLAASLAFGGYHLAHVMLSEHTAPILLTPTDPRTGEPVRVRPGNSYAWQWLLNGRAEENALVILARRHHSFDLDGLSENLTARFVRHSPTPNEVTVDLVGARNFLISRAPGALWFGFRTTKGGDVCAAPSIPESSALRTMNSPSPAIKP